MMRYLLVHCLIKDTSFFFAFHLVAKIINPDNPSRIGWPQTFIIVDILLLGSVYLVLKIGKIHIRTFWFGALLHLLLLLLVWTGVNLDERILSLLIASFVSAIISGFVYQFLNSKREIENQIRNLAGIEPKDK